MIGGYIGKPIGGVLNIEAEIAAAAWAQPGLTRLPPRAVRSASTAIFYVPLPPVAEANRWFQPLSRAPAAARQARSEIIQVPRHVAHPPNTVTIEKWQQPLSRATSRIAFPSPWIASGGWVPLDTPQAERAGGGDEYVVRHRRRSRR